MASTLNTPATTPSSAYNGWMVGSSMSGRAGTPSKASQAFMPVYGSWSTPLMPDGPGVTSELMKDEMMGCGISTMKQRLQSGKDLVFSIVAAPITQAYADRSIPRKFLQWLGVYKEEKGEFQ